MPDYEGLIKYPIPSDRYNSTYGEPQWWAQLASTVRAEIAQKVQEGAFVKPFAGTGGDLDGLVEPGLHSYWTDWANRPSDDSGHVFVLPPPLGTGGALTQIAVPYGLFHPGMYYRFRGGDGVTWASWTRFDAGAIEFPEGAGTSASSASMKVVPLALTVGGGPSARWDSTEGGVRIPIRYAGPVTRYRVHIRNINPRVGTPGSGTVNVPNVWVGEHAGGGIVDGGNTSIGGGLSSTGEDMVTPWVNAPLEADTDYLLTFRWNSTEPTRSVVGGGWTTAAASDAAANSATTTRRTSLPLDVWIEAETYSQTPVVAAFGDSISSGVGADTPVFDSWLSQWARDNGALPVHYTASGDTMEGWGNSSHYKWQRWQHLSRPDAVVHAMGSNDVFNGVSLSTMRSRRAQSLELLEDLVSPVIYSSTLLPRDAETGTQEQIRRDYNAEVLALTDSRDAFDFVPAVSGNDETISPGYNADGTHLNTAGYAALAGTITRPLASNALANMRARLAVLEYDTGWRDITSLAQIPVTSGRILLRRTGKDVKVRFEDLFLSSGTGGTLIFLPSGFRPEVMEANTVRGVSFQAQLSAVGNLQLFNYQPETRIGGGLAATTDQAPPTTLPGDPA